MKPEPSTSSKPGKHMTPHEAAEKFLEGKHLDEPILSKEWLTKLIAECVATQNPELTMEEFLRELTASEPESKTAPGLQISWLEERQMFYAAIHVFPMGSVASRTVLVKSLATDLTTCLVKLLVAYRESRK